MSRKGGARPVDSPRPPEPPSPFVSLDGIGLEGTIAAIVGGADDSDNVRRMVQQAYRADNGFERGCTYNGWLVAEALYQQLVGTWSVADKAILTDWRTHSFIPEYVEGPNGFAHERRLSDKALAELARVEPYP